MRSLIVRAAFAAALASTTLSTIVAAQKTTEPAPTGRERIAAQKAQGKLDTKPAGNGVEAHAASTLKSGVYSLNLTPTSIDGRPAPASAKPSVTQVAVTTTNSAIDMTGSAGAKLTGVATDRVFTVSGQGGDGTLALTGTRNNDGATGAFTMKLNGGHTAIGKFVLKSANESGLTARSMKLKEYVAPKAAAASDCNWWCTFKGWISL